MLDYRDFRMRYGHPQGVDSYCPRSLVQQPIALRWNISLLISIVPLEGVIPCPAFLPTDKRVGFLGGNIL
ncbi:MAG: hypothetical protein KME08_00665 [Aphanothece sp. CMT-3BRIN-NPC111]|nr:hypothetical protein [Aphanothece sp. CMT-3BRIN-NPC111]